MSHPFDCSMIVVGGHGCGWLVAVAIAVAVVVGIAGRVCIDENVVAIVVQGFVRDKVNLVADTCLSMPFPPWKQDGHSRKRILLQHLPRSGFTFLTLLLNP